MYQNFFSYEDSLVTYFSKWSGGGTLSEHYFRLWYELPDSFTCTDLTFQSLGVGRGSGFGYFLLYYVPPHCALMPQMVWNVVRLFKIFSLKGKRHSQGLPVNGQRTHSNNSSNIFKMRVQTVLQSVRAGISFKRLASLGRGKFDKISLRVGSKQHKGAHKSKIKKSTEKQSAKKKTKVKANIWK